LILGWEAEDKPSPQPNPDGDEVLPGEGVLGAFAEFVGGVVVATDLHLDTKLLIVVAGAMMVGALVESANDEGDE